MTGSSGPGGVGPTCTWTSALREQFTADLPNQPVDGWNPDGDLHGHAIWPGIWREATTRGKISATRTGSDDSDGADSIVNSQRRGRWSSRMQFGQGLNRCAMPGTVRIPSWSFREATSVWKACEEPRQPRPDGTGQELAEGLRSGPMSSVPISQAHPGTERDPASLPASGTRAISRSSEEPGHREGVRSGHAARPLGGSGVLDGQLHPRAGGGHARRL